MARINQRLNGLNPLAYIGDNSYQPPEFVTYNRAPTANDSQNFELGTIWLDMSSYPTPPGAEDVWMLVALVGGTATWVNFAGGANALETLTADAGANPVSGDVNDNINLFGAHGINTLATLNTITTAINNAITLGDLAVLGSGVNALMVTTGDIGITAGNLKLPFTNTGGTQGTIQLGGFRFISDHEFGDNLQSTFVGNNSGNTTNTGVSNSGFGSLALFNLTTGQVNCCAGTQSLFDLTTGSRNSCFGSFSGDNIVTGTDNSLVGYASGTNYTGAESSNVLLAHAGVLGESNTLRLGTTGNGAGQVNRAFIAGVSGVTVSNQVDVVMDSVTGQLGTIAGGAGTLSTLTGNSGGAVSPTAGNINILGSGVITVVGNPGTSTLTVTPSGAIASSFITNPVTGTATPSSGVLTFAGTGDITVSAAGSTVTISGTGSGLSLCAFQAYLSADVPNATGAGTSYTVVFDTAVYNIGSAYNTATGIFTAPLKGVYQFNQTVAVKDLSAAMDQLVMNFTAAGTGPSTAQLNSGCRMNPYVMRSANTPQWRITDSVTMALDVGDTVLTSIGISNGVGDTATIAGSSGGSYSTHMSGFLVGLRA